MNTSSMFERFQEANKDLTVSGKAIHDILDKLVRRKKDLLFDIADDSFVFGTNGTMATYDSNMLLSNIVCAYTTTIVGKLSVGNRVKNVISKIIIKDREKLISGVQDILSEHPLFYDISNQERNTILLTGTYTIDNMYEMLVDIFHPHNSTLDGMVADFVDNYLTNPSFYAYSINDGKCTGRVLKHAEIDAVLVDLEVKHRDLY